MPRNRILECPICFKSIRSDLLKSHCKSKHGMNDDEIKSLKTYSCEYCKKNNSRSVPCRYHELHCTPRKPDDIGYKHDVQFGRGHKRNGDFEEIEQGLEDPPPTLNYYVFDRRFGLGCKKIYYQRVSLPYSGGKNLCKHCIVLNTQGSDVRKLSQQTHCSIVF